MMNLRLARPANLVDLNRVGDFPGLSIGADGAFRIGPLVRHHDLEKLAGQAGIAGYFARIAPDIAHLPVRIRGTLVGSVAHADPASEWCAALLAASGSVTMRSQTQERTIPIEDFLHGSYATARTPEELLVEVTVPALRDGCGLGFAEVSRRPGDFALAMSAASLVVCDQVVSAARVVVGGVGGGIARCGPAEEALVGAPPSPESWTNASNAAATSVEVHMDTHSSAAYGRQLVRTVVFRALEEAALRAAGQ